MTLKSGHPIAKIGLIELDVKLLAKILDEKFNIFSNRISLSEYVQNFEEIQSEFPNIQWRIFNDFPEINGEILSILSARDAEISKICNFGF
jgi:hypothetical protein